jgi:hypothetical protein
MPYRVKRKTGLKACFMLATVFAALLQGCSLGTHGFSGVYRYSDGDGAVEFRDGKFLQYDLPGRNLVYESTYFVKGNRLYVRPNRQESSIMIRRVAIVYIISGNQLIPSHLEDLDTGDVFEKETDPKVVLRKE